MVRRHKNNHIALFIVLFLFAGLVIAGIILMYSPDDTRTVSVRFPLSAKAAAYDEDCVIPEGIYIGTEYVGGLDKAAARAVLNEAYGIEAEGQVTVYWRMTAVSATLSELGVSLNIDEAIDKAITLSLGGGIVRRYMTEEDLSAAEYHIEFTGALDYDSVKKFVTERLSAVYDRQPVSASISVDDSGKFVIASGINGLITNIDETVGVIMDNYLALEQGSNLMAIAVVDETEPEITTEDLFHIDDLLGSYTTCYRNREWGERTDRCTNVEVATANINGTLLMPGESVSTSTLMKERTVENGYATGGQYVNGQLEDAIGGGVCQVASTLYNALLYSELQIDKRSNHSLLVSYVDPSRDAAIATGSKDLVFTNNLEYPIYIRGITDGYDVTFEVYGEEYRSSSRRVELVSVVESRTASENIEKEDPELYVGETRKEGASHDECNSHLEKVVYENDTEISREILHEDYYMASHITVYSGTKEKDGQVTQTEAADPDDSENDS